MISESPGDCTPSGSHLPSNRVVICYKLFAYLQSEPCQYQHRGSQSIFFNMSAWNPSFLALYIMIFGPVLSVFLGIINVFQVCSGRRNLLLMCSTVLYSVCGQGRRSCYNCEHFNCEHFLWCKLKPQSSNSTLLIGHFQLWRSRNKRSKFQLEGGRLWV